MRSKIARKAAIRRENLAKALQGRVELYMWNTAGRVCQDCRQYFYRICICVGISICFLYEVKVHAAKLARNTLACICTFAFV